MSHHTELTRSAQQNRPAISARMAGALAGSDKKFPRRTGLSNIKTRASINKKLGCSLIKKARMSNKKQISL